MKNFLFLFVILFTQSCSFDNKSRIWKNNNEKLNDSSFADFEEFSPKNKTFNKLILYDGVYNFKLEPKVKNFDWSDIYYGSNNNLENLSYSENNNILFKTKKLTKHKINNNVLFEKDSFILSDESGDIITFSVSQNKFIKKFNFYKKKFKNIDKKINMIVENSIIYITDNIGFTYAYNFKSDKLLWAKDYKIPFRSNLKIFQEKLITANQNNDLIFINKKNGEILQKIPTEETKIKNKFVNNLSLNNDLLIFLNTYGSIYGIDSKSMKIKWFLNINQSTDKSLSNLFDGSEVISIGKIVVVSSKTFTYIINVVDGSLIFRKNFSSALKPIINSSNLFIISKNNLLLAVDVMNGNVIYSYDVNQKIADFIKSKKYKVNYRFMMLVNNKIFVYLKNSYILKFSIKGDLLEIVKLPTKLNSNPIIINNKILFVDIKNKLIAID